MRTLIQRIRSQDIIMVGKNQIIPPCHPYSCIRIFRNPQRLLCTDNTDSPIHTAVFLQNPGQRRIFPASVRQAQLPRTVTLAPDRLNQFPEIRRLRAEQRNYYAKHRHIRKLLIPLPCKLPLIRSILRYPFRIRNSSRADTCQLLHHPPRHALRTVFFIIICDFIYKLHENIFSFLRIVTVRSVHSNFYLSAVLIIVKFKLHVK